METKVLNTKGEEVGKAQLADAIFGVKPQKTFLHEVVTAYLANRRRGTAETKTRGEVSGGGHKPWKQKHTGRARAGSNRSPLWRKGGIVFGPHLRSYRQNLPKAKRVAALAQALSAQAKAGSIQVVDEFKVAEPKTKEFVQVVKALALPHKSLVVLDKPDATLARAGRNVQGIAQCQYGDLNAYLVLNCRRIVLTQAALEQIQKSLS